MMLGMMLFWIAALVGFVWLVHSGIEHRRDPLAETALSILDRRFAEGTISVDDYRERKGILTGATVVHSDRGVGSPATEER
jgi:uncharacterized membrane protein